LVQLWRSVAVADARIDALGPGLVIRRIRGGLDGLGVVGSRTSAAILRLDRGVLVPVI
jgi:hypothetical protein